jgi:alpha-glucoside transport system permease protein
MSKKRQKLISDILVNGSLLLLCLLWTLPSLGMLVSSFRPRDDVLTTGWWKINWSELTLKNYNQVFTGKEIADPGMPGGVLRLDMSQHFQQPGGHSSLDNYSS